MKLNKLKVIQLWLFWAISDRFVSSVDHVKRCLWKGSSATSSEPTVMRMKTDCSRGKIQWLKPFGGLRATFYPRGIERVRKKSFKVCFKTKGTGVSVYNDEYTRLKLLKSATDKRTGKRICVNSTGGPVVLYLETSKGNISIINILYTVIFQNKRIEHRLEKECQICSPFRILRSLCNSDFVVKGRIISTVQLDDHVTQTRILAKDLLRQSANIFVREKRSKFASPIGSVQLPATCRWNKRKLYIFTGSIVSGRGPVLGCYSEETIWMEMKKQYIDHLCKYGVPIGSDSENVKQ